MLKAANTSDKQPPKGYKVIEGSERVLAVGAKRIGTADPKETFQVIICLRRKPGAPPLPDLAYWQATPPGQRKFLSPEEFGSTYGADPAELEQVAKYFRDQGLTITESSAARRTITVSGSVQDMGRAFGVEFGRYKTEKETYRSHEGAAYLPSDVAPLVESVFGLDNRRIGGNNTAPNTDPQITGQLDAWSIAKHYNFPNNAANNQVIGIITIDGGGFTQGDITKYFANLNQLNNTNLQAPTPVVAKGGNNNPGTQQLDFELTQDICVAATVAQGAKILVFFETADATGWIDFVKRASVPKLGDPAVTVMSISNVIAQDDNPNTLPQLSGFSAMEITTLETAFQEAAVTGVSIFVASGDQGSNYNGIKHRVQWPASNPWVTACGGTTVGALQANPNQLVDWVWNDQFQNNSFATGGGVSDKYPLPDYQQGIVTQKSLNDQQIRRGVPDIAGNASPNSGYALWVDGTNKVQNTNNFIVANGTSIVSPLYAGLAAVINAALGQSVGFLNPTLYAFHDSVCRDVNDQLFPGSPIDNGPGMSPGYPSGPGWDACTGLGVVDGSALLAALQGLFTKKTFFILERSTFGKDEVDSLGMNPQISPVYWIAVDGFTPADLQLTQNNLNAPPIRPHIAMSVDPGPPPAQVQAIQAMLTAANIDNFAGPVLPLDSQLPNTPQRFLFPFAIAFTGDAGFTPNDASVTLTATLTVNNVQYPSTAQIFLVQKENPYLLDANPTDPEQPLWLSFDLRFFKANQNQSRFGAAGINDPSGAPGFITQVLTNLNGNMNLGGDSFDGLSQDEDQSALEFLPQVNQQYVFNYALARVRLRGAATAQTVRVFFRLFQAQTTSSEFNMQTTYRRFPANGVQYGQKIALLGVQNDQANQPEYVTVPCFASPRINRGALADLTTQTDAPNAHDIVPMPGQEVIRYFGCWLDINQPDPLFPSTPPPNDFDNQMGTWANLPMNNPLLSIPQMIMKGPHQCLIAEIAFDDAPISPNENSGNSDKLAQRNIAWIDGPNPGQDISRRMPHPFQVRATAFKAEQPDEIMIDWGNTPDGSTASVYLPAVSSAQIIQLANRMYTRHGLRVQDAHTIECNASGATFIPLPPGTGLNAGLMTIDLPHGIRKGDLYEVMVRQITTMRSVIKRDQIVAGGVHRWRQVLGGFRIAMPISTKHALRLKEERLLAFFRWIAQTLSPSNRWYQVFHRYLEQIAGRVKGFGGDPTKILPSPTGEVPGGGPVHHGKEIEFAGKIEGIIYDHFGDFEGFILELFDGEKRRFVSREHSVWKVVYRASVERLLITVIVREFHPHVPLELIVQETPEAFGH